MSLFIGFFPDENSKSKIKEITSEIKKVFDGFDIDVRWSNPNTYHLTLLFLGNKVLLPKMLYYKYKLKKLSFKKFQIRFNSIKLGMSRKYRELLYLDVLEGGEEMRKLYLVFRDLLSFKNDINFIPHLTLGRVNKDCSQQEYSNIIKDLSVVSKQLKIKNLNFDVNSIEVVKSEEGKYEIVLSITGR